jgi:ribosome-binding factor A
MFTVHGMAEVELERVRQGLDNASGYFRRAIAKRLRTKVSPTVTFEVDHVFDQAERVEKLLHEVAEVAPDGGEDGHEDGDEDEDGAEGDKGDGDRH